MPPDTELSEEQFGMVARAALPISPPMNRERVLPLTEPDEWQSDTVPLSRVPIIPPRLLESLLAVMEQFVRQLFIVLF